jgi:hypothetical protein
MVKLGFVCSTRAVMQEYVDRVVGFDWEVDEKTIVTGYRDFVIGCPCCFSILRLRLYPGFHKSRLPKDSELVLIRYGEFKAIKPRGKSLKRDSSSAFLDHRLKLKKWSGDIELCTDREWADAEERKRILKMVEATTGVRQSEGFVIPL